MGYKKSINELSRTLPISTGSFLITGATGLIGSCIIDTLIAANNNGANFKIYALSRSKDKIINRFKNNVIPLAQNIMESLPEDIKVNYIFHCASNADPRSYANNPVETILTNIEGCRRVFDYCKANIDTKVLLTSTFEVYGSLPGVSSFTEDMSGVIDQTVLRNGYPESKRVSELLLRSYVDEYNISAVIARLPSVYGPTMKKDDSKAHAQFIRNALNNENIVLKSRGQQRRTYCYVIDAVSALFTILFKGKCGEAYNISNENSISSIAEVANTCANIAGTKVIYELPDEVEAKGFSRSTDCILDNSKLKALGWNAIYDLKSGLSETIESLKNEMRIIN